MIDDAAPAIATSGLIKTFGSNRAVDGIDLVVRRGSIYGLLGPNGAGKTTIVRVLATLLQPDGGSARVLGLDVVADADAVRRRISLTGQFASVDEDLTGYENLVLLGRLLGYRRREAKARSDELLAAFGLSEATHRQVKDFSGGMRRRLDIAASLVVIPDLLFLDEPTTGLDPRSRNQVWDIIRMLTRNGTTVLLTTQYLEEADQLADRIAVIDHGKVIAEGPSAELKASVGSGVLHIRLAEAGDRGPAAIVLRARFAEAVHTDNDPRVLTVQLADPGLAAAGLADLASAGIAISEFSLGQPSLDEVFFALTGRTAEATNGGAVGDGMRKEAAE
jgi:ABC-2 type transport system ATP-binding protein